MKFFRRPDIDTLTRAEIAAQAFLGMGSYGQITRIAGIYNVSRLFVYKLLWQLMLLYEIEVRHPDTRQASKKEVDRHILLLRMEGHCSLQHLSQIIGQLGLPFSSVGYISQRLTAYARSLPKEVMTGAQLTFVLCDEIFALGQPILITVEPRSLVILKIELVDKRDAQTWKQHWEELTKAGLIQNPIVVSDQGSGLVKGCEMMGLIHHPDLFHLLRHLAAFEDRFYRQALSDIEKEYERARVFESGKSARVLEKRMEDYEAAMAQALESIYRYDDFCYLWRELREALELFDEDGKIRDLASRLGDIEACLELMSQMRCEKLSKEVGSLAAGLEGYWGYYQRAEETYQKLIEVHGSEVVEVLASPWQMERQATNSKDYGVRKRLRKEAEFYFGYVESLVGEQAEEIRKEVMEALDGEVRSSSLIENVNSTLRPMLESSRGEVSQERLELFAWVHNHRRFMRGKRAGKAPIEILTGKDMEESWLDSLLELEAV